MKMVLVIIIRIVHLSYYFGFSVIKRLPGEAQMGVSRWVCLSPQTSALNPE